MYGHRQIVEQVLQVPLVVGQVGDRALLDRLLSGGHPATGGEPIQAVLHFAAYAYVGESVTDPAKYYRNNLGDSLTLLEALKAEGERRGGPPLPLVFSSTCASYGIPEPEQLPIAESCPQRPINPYGRSKWMVEQLLADFGAAYGLPSVIFRYFNAAGADPAGDLGEDHNPETHLIPLVLDAAKAATCRGLLAHVAPRRLGDPPVLVASAEKARRELGWQPLYPELSTILQHAWTWHQRAAGCR